MFNLPNVTKKGAVNVYALHIHEKGDCTKPFDQTGNHYSRTKADHPNHTGDLMPLLGNEGYAWMAFYDKRVLFRSKQEKGCRIIAAIPAA